MEPQKIPISKNESDHPIAELGVCERLADQPPQLIESNRGIAVYPNNDFPRLPILGLRAIAENNLVLNVDGLKRQATLRTCLHWLPFS